MLRRVFSFRSFFLDARKVASRLKRWFHFCITGRLRSDATELIRRNLGSGDIFSIQIGSNDGRSGDPIFSLVHENTAWRGLFVEPVPHLFEQLCANYASRDGLMFRNVAINNGTKQKFFWVDPRAREKHPELPKWVEQLGSFHEHHIPNVPEIGNVLLAYRREIEIEGWTFASLLEQCRVTHFDLLHIDTEGYDWEILQQLDLTRYRPRVIMYEHKCLNHEDKQSAIRHVSPYYEIHDLGGDMLCIARKERHREA